MNFDQLITRLAEGVEGHSIAREARGERHAAVLILFTDSPDPEVTLIVRASTLRRHAGQVAFPGGGQDPEDATVVAAALREANEEVGLDPRLVRVLGCLPVSWVPRSRYDVTPVVALWDGSQQLRAVDLGEVESVVQVRVADLVDPVARVSGRHPSGFVGPAFWAGDLMVWGFTAYLLDLVFAEAGWAQPWEATNTVDVPARFLRD